MIRSEKYDVQIKSTAPDFVNEELSPRYMISYERKMQVNTNAITPQLQTGRPLASSPCSPL